MQHPDEGMIHAWLDGALSADDAAGVEAHVKECPECAATVAEARGFIAASSRILTALDDAPRGVIPAARPKRRFDSTMVRIAASVLVVAAGTLVVVRNQGSEMRSEANTRDTTSAMRAVESAPTVAAPAQSQIDGAGNSAPATGANALSQRSTADNAVEAPGTDRSPTSERRVGQVGTRRDFSKIGAAQGAGASQADAERVETGNAKAAQGYVAVPAPPPPVSRAPVAGVAALDGAVASESLRVIDTTRRIGANVTVYEVAGDTVTLTESARLELSGVVVTAAAAPAAQGAIRAEGSSNRAATAMAAQPDSVTRRAVPPPMASAIPPVSQGRALREAVEAIHTITWLDPATGRTFTLTGKMSEARLQQIRLRIESERATAKKISR